MQNGTIKQALDRARKADIASLGIGDTNENSYMVEPGWFTPHKIIDARQHQSVTGNIAGDNFFNAHGQHIATVMNNRVIGPTLEKLRKILCVMTIAYENTRAPAILGALYIVAMGIIATSAQNIRTIINMTPSHCGQVAALQCV